MPEREQGAVRLAARGARSGRDLVHLAPVHATEAGEEQDRVVRRRHEQVLDEVFLATNGKLQYFCRSVDQDG
jgi:hypothetical protein